MTPDDEFLAIRIREILRLRPGYSEKKMFGGVAFFLDGNMCVAPWEGSLVVRLDKANHDETQAEPYVQPMDLTGRVMRGWARVEPEGIQTDEELRAWVHRAVDFVQTLPPKG